MGKIGGEEQCVANPKDEAAVGFRKIASFDEKSELCIGMNGWTVRVTGFSKVEIRVEHLGDLRVGIFRKGENSSREVAIKRFDNVFFPLIVAILDDERIEAEEWDKESIESRVMGSE